MVNILFTLCVAHMRSTLANARGKLAVINNRSVKMVYILVNHTKSRSHSHTTRTTLVAASHYLKVTYINKIIQTIRTSLCADALRPSFTHSFVVTYRVSFYGSSVCVLVCCWPPHLFVIIFPAFSSGRFFQSHVAQPPPNVLLDRLGSIERFPPCSISSSSSHVARWPPAAPF